MNYIISISPLSQEFKNTLSSRLNISLEYMTLSELRRNSLKSIVKSIFNLKANSLIVALEDVESHSILPVLEAFSLFVSAKNKYRLDASFNLKKISWFTAGAAFTKLIFNSARLFFYYGLCSLESRYLLKAAPKTITLAETEKALFINANLWFGIKAGGSVGHIAGVVNAFLKNNCQIIYCAASKNNLINDANFYQLQSLSGFGFPDELNHFKFSYSITKELSKKLGVDQVKFIYQRLSQSNYSGVQLSRKFNIPLILEYNGSEVWCAAKWGRSLKYSNLALQVEEVCIRHAHRIVTISSVLKEELIQRGVSAEKIICYPNCIDPDIFNPDRFPLTDLMKLKEYYGIQPHSLVFTFVGTFGKWHGVEVLAQAISKLIDEQEDILKLYHIKFLLIGDGMMMPEVKKSLNHPHYKSYVILPGLIAQSEAPIHLAMSDVLLSPHVPNADGSRFFGSPTKLFEYMAMGKAIIASDLEQIGEVLADSVHVNQEIEIETITTQCALLCRPGVIDDIIKAILLLLSNPNWKESLGANARKLALEKYTWDKHVETILKNISVHDKNTVIPAKAGI